MLLSEAEEQFGEKNVIVFFLNKLSNWLKVDWYEKMSD